MPSSHRYHSPVTCINPSDPLPRDIAQEASVVFRVRRRRQRQRLFRCIRDEQLLAGNTDALAAITGVDLGGVRLQPRGIAVEALMLRPRPREFFGIGHHFHDYRRLFWHLRSPDTL